jgi:DNA-directed RNA polymerase subunit RPC12/RpoP
MAASARLVGLVLIGAGLFLGVVIPLWLYLGTEEGTLEGSGAIFGLALFFGILVIPLLGGGLYFFRRGQAEAKDLSRVQEQRRLLGIISTRGQIAIADLVLEVNSSRERVQNDLYDLVNRGLFSGYVDWSKGLLYSVEASQLQGKQTCPNCGGALELAGKGLIKCPYCGAEIFLQR